MRVRTTRSHLGGHPNGLHDFLLGGSMFQGELCMPTDALGTLGHVRDSHGDQLFGFGRQCAIGEYALPECLKRAMDIGGELSSLAPKFLCTAWIGALVHVELSSLRRFVRVAITDC
jgi:hypothetical protein